MLRPRDIALGHGTEIGGGGVDWTVPVYILHSDSPGDLPPGEDPLPPDNGDPHPFFAFLVDEVLMLTEISYRHMTTPILMDTVAIAAVEGSIITVRLMPLTSPTQHNYNWTRQSLRHCNLRPLQEGKSR